MTPFSLPLLALLAAGTVQPELRFVLGPCNATTRGTIVSVSESASSDVRAIFVCRKERDEYKWKLLAEGLR